MTETNEKGELYKFSIREQLFTIPNILSYIRLLLIPVIIFKYLHASSVKDYRIVAVIVAVSGITDMLDGFIARKLNMITELGKALDPVADKLTHIALVICLSVRYRWMLSFLALVIIKESFMGIMGIIMLKKKQKKLDGAKWFGKVSTAIFDFFMVILILFPSIPESYSIVMIMISAVFMIISFIGYIFVFRKMWKEN
ncbi:CDP-alcohol phosphatidyltransferase family protein [Velocimicrobium porci]|uniref:CDP-diacylglycerol--glycerol-3-phosphate 3-phosphatidyltransferase n=1 Tax=Velocimicrobium porci TaxID=2606634 RepID=A0A6L5Y2L8_9FIRM|nr:CDP-alcohol phosphatidyltransferase family protein [Velocimicrobium porci]MSS64363.1 CDP-alcohol phosphatidyltransferase family protein [Velocimicrobium porci]